jgi:hypothetical protein
VQREAVHRWSGTCQASESVKKGAPNSADVKAFIMAAFADAGGKDYLVSASRSSKTRMAHGHGSGSANPTSSWFEKQ